MTTRLLPTGPASHPRVNCHSRKAPGQIYVTLMAAACLTITGCQKKQEATPVAPVVVAKSAIEVTATPGAVIVRTPTAKFTLTASGALQGSLEKGGTSLSLDAKADGAGQVISIGKKIFPGLHLDLEHAQVQEPSGKLGALGKKIVIAGNVPETGLDETVTVEVYDAFPQLALLSATLRNVTAKDVALDAVTLQRHIFATPATSANTRAALEL